MPSFPITVPYTFGSFTGVVQLSYLDSNFTPIVTALNGISSGTYPLVAPDLGTPVSATLTNATGLPLATGVTGTLPVISGGTGVTTSTGSGANVLSTSPTLVTPILGTPTSITLTNATGLSLTSGVTGTLPVLNGGTGVTTSTGSGANVLSTSPTFVTPILGTPTSVNLTNATGLSLTTGVSGTLPVANGGTGVTSTTGSGANVLATSPTLVTPILGTPTSITLTNATGLPISGISATGTPSGTTYLRGDGSWATVSGSSSLTVNTTTITGGTTGRILYDNAGVVGELATVPVANGGTGLTSYSTGDIVYASATNTLSKLAAGTNGYVLTLTAGVPSWAAGGGGLTIGTTSISGGTTGRILYDNAGVVGELATVPVANGGTGAATLTANAVLIGNGTSAVTAVAPGTSGNLLTSDGTNWASSANTGVSTGKAIAMAIVFGG